MNDLVELRHIESDTFFSLTKNYYEKENGKVHFYYTGNKTYGIFLDDKLVGFITCSKMMDNLLEVRTYVKEGYRGRRIAPKAKELIVNELGKEMPECPSFISLIDYKNESSLKSAKNCGWNFDWQLTEMISEEGGECLQVFTKNNPFYKKGKRLVNEYDRK